MQPADPTVVLDREQLKNITMEDEFLMREIVGALLTDTAQQIEKIKEALEAGRVEDCAKLAHSAKGACANVGASAMAAAFAALEADAKRGDLAACRERRERVAGEFENLRQAANQL